MTEINVFQQFIGELADNVTKDLSNKSPLHTAITSVDANSILNDRDISKLLNIEKDKLTDMQKHLIGKHIDKQIRIVTIRQVYIVE